MVTGYLPTNITWFRLPEYVRNLYEREYALGLELNELNLIIDNEIVSTVDLSGLGGGGGSQTLQETLANGNTATTNILMSGTTPINFGSAGNGIYKSEEGDDLNIDSLGQIRQNAVGGNLYTLLGQNAFTIQDTSLNKSAVFSFVNNTLSYNTSSGNAVFNFASVSGVRTYTAPNGSGVIPLSVNGNTADASGDISIPTFEPRTVDTASFGATFSVSLNATDHRNKWLVTSQQDGTSGVVQLSTAGIGGFTPGDEIIFINNGTGEVRVVNVGGVTVITPTQTGPIYSFQEGERLSIVVIDSTTVSYHVTTA